VVNFIHPVYGDLGLAAGASTLIEGEISEKDWYYGGLQILINNFNLRKWKT
jgi:hypothetical protein